MLELTGWIGSTLFAACAIPQCIKAYKTKSMNDFSWTFLLMWFFGEILTFSYVFITNHIVGLYQIPLLANYFFNFILLLYLIYVKLWHGNYKFVRKLKCKLFGHVEAKMPVVNHGTIFYPCIRCWVHIRDMIKDDLEKIEFLDKIKIEKNYE